MAVEMCKLSLWLVSLDPKLPFSFVDDKVLHGNSLLGLTDVRQLKAMHIDPDKITNAPSLFDLDVDAILRRAANLRRRLATEVDDLDPQRSAITKRRQLRELQETVTPLALIADGVIAAGLALSGKSGKALNAAYENLRQAVADAFPAEGDGDQIWLDKIISEGLTPTVPTDYQRWKPLHWTLAVPDVMERGGFDAVIGNPPFLGGKKISGAAGSNVREWLVNVLACEVKGNADLVAYFFLQAWSLLSAQGNLGLIATNTVAQTDTREVGLDRMVDEGFEITRAIQSAHWPSASASLEYSAVWGTRSAVSEQTERIADGTAVSRISSLLEPEGRIRGQPRQLRENQLLAFSGSFVNGVDEFTMPIDHAAEMIRADPRLSIVLRPYIGGEDLNRRPTANASRWIVDFTGVPDEAVEQYGAAYEWLHDRAKPARQRLASKPRLQERWWAYEAPGMVMRRFAAELDELLVIARVSKTVMPLRLPTNQVFSEQIVVFATDSHNDQAVLSSNQHQIWAITYGSGLRNDPRYTPSDVFETFPRPAPTDWLDKIGRRLDTERREIMLRRQLGLTKLYNLINDPDITDPSDDDVAKMRAIHVELDRAVMDAYGWTDVDLDHGFHTYRQMQRWTVSPAARVEILDRLLEENHRRAGAQGTTPASTDDEEEAEA
jgi:hypothetical protein